MVTTSEHRWLGIILTLIGILIYLASKAFPNLPEGHPGPGLFPSGIAILLCICGVILFFTSSGQLQKSSKDQDFSNIFRIAILFVTIGVFPILSNTINFYIGLFICISIVAILFGIKWWRGLVISSLTVLFIYLLFAKLLSVPL